VTVNPKIQDKLNSAALIVRKYNLGTYSFFQEKFNQHTKEDLDSSWAFSLSKIQNSEIVKDANDISQEEQESAVSKAKSFHFDLKNVFIYLNSGFDPKALKLTDEKIERRFRNIIALKYIEVLSTEKVEIFYSEKKKLKSLIADFFGKYKIAIVLLSIVVVLSTPRLIEGFTPVEELAKKLHENSKYDFNGSICNDGKVSHSQGRGTCSWHGGVRYRFYTGDYSKSIEECRVEAKRLSWRD